MKYEISFKVYVGDDWSSFEGNTLVAEDVNVPQYSPLNVELSGAIGQYLWIVRDTSELTLCEIEVFEIPYDGNFSSYFQAGLQVWLGETRPGVEIQRVFDTNIATHTA